MSETLKIIGHYQRSIERSQNGSDNTNNGKLLHCIDKLYRLPVTVDHLQATGVGKTVNSLRKYDGEVGVAAKALVAKWKAMVTADEYATETAATANKTDDDDENDNDDDEDDINGIGGNDTGIGYGDNEQKTRNNIQIVHSEKDDDKKSESRHRNHTSSHRHDSSKKSSSRGHSSSSKSKHKSDRREEKSSHKSHNYQNDDLLKSLTPKLDENLEIQQSDSDDKLVKCNDSIKIEKHHQHSSNSRDKNNKHLSASSTSKDHHHSRGEEKTSSTTKSSSSSSKHRKEHNRDNHKSSSSNSSKDKDKNHHKSSSHTNKTKENHSNNNNNNRISKNYDKINKRRHSITETEGKVCEVTSSSSTTQSPMNKTKKQKIIHDEIDSTTGTSFEDALGMMMPTKLSSNSTNKNTTKIKSPNISKSNSTPVNSSSNGASSSNSASCTKNISISKNTNGTTIPMKDDIEKVTPALLALTSAASLKPLDPNIALELPTVSISNNYKPMPLNQTVMDCVFRSNQPPKTTRTDAETLQHSISSKTMRTKVYSGQRSGQRYQPPKLFDLCIRFLQKNIDAIEYCGGYPYEILRHFLERATPPQLLNFEEWNQYIIEDTDELWQKHVQRHCRGQKRQEMESWREMYMRCKENEEHRLNMLAENIKQSQKLVAAPLKKTQLAFVDSMVKPPRNIQRKQDQFGTNKKLIATPAARVASLCNLTPNAIKTGDVRLRIAAGERDNAQVSGFIRPKKAPLMAKTLQLMKGRFKR